LPLSAALDFSWIALLFCSAVAFCVRADEHGSSLPILHSRALRYLGMVSYAMYIWHFILTLLIQRWLPQRTAEASLAAVGCGLKLLGVTADGEGGLARI